VEKLKLRDKLLQFSGRMYEGNEGSKKRNLIVYIVLGVMILGAIGLYYYARTFAKVRYLTDRPIPIPIAEGAIWEVMARATPHLVGIIGASIVIAIVSLSFQTITHSRVLSPSMVGFPAVFVGTQTLLVFFLGAQHFLFANPFVNFLLTSGIMVAVSVLMFGAVLRSHKNNIVFLLMFGIVISGIIMSSSNYLRLMLTEADFFQLMAAINVNVPAVDEGIIWFALPFMVIVVVLTMMRHRRYNVMTLGSEQAKGLGIHYEKELRINLILIAFGMSIVTALIGPLTFLGLLAVNAAREMLKTYKHMPLFIASSLLAMVVLIAGQGLMELMLGAVPVTVIVDIVGCAYVFFLILKENRV